MPAVASGFEDRASRESPIGPSLRLRDDSISESDRNFAVAMHLTPFAGLITGLLVFTPIVLWLIRKDDSPFCDDHGREIINFGISLILLHLILVPIAIVTLTLGLLLYPVLWVVAVVSMIRAAIAAGNGEYFRYPVTFRFLS